MSIVKFGNAIREKDIPPRRTVAELIAESRVGDVPLRGEPLTPPIIWLGRQWAVTGYGVERRDGNRHVSVDDLEQDWEAHYARKTWIDMPDFAAAMAVARQHYRISRGRADPQGSAAFVRALQGS